MKMNYKNILVLIQFLYKITKLMKTFKNFFILFTKRLYVLQNSFHVFFVYIFREFLIDFAFNLY